MRAHAFFNLKMTVSNVHVKTLTLKTFFHLNVRLGQHNIWDQRPSLNGTRVHLHTLLNGICSPGFLSGMFNNVTVGDETSKDKVSSEILPWRRPERLKLFFFFLLSHNLLYLGNSYHWKFSNNSGSCLNRTVEFVVWTVNPSNIWMGNKWSLFYNLKERLWMPS